MPYPYNPESLAPNKFPAVYSAAKYLMKLAVKTGLVDITVRGLENLPEDGGYTAAFTHHASYWDVAAVGQAIISKSNYPARFMTKSEYYKNPVAARALNHLKGFPVNRDTFDTESLDFASLLLENGHIVAAAPEGGVVHDDEIPKKLKRGIGMISCLSSTEVVPIAAYGEKQVRRVAGRKFIWIPKTFVQIGEPIRPPEAAGPYNIRNIDLQDGRPPLELQRLARQIDQQLRPALVSTYDSARQGYRETYGTVVAGG